MDAELAGGASASLRVGRFVVFEHKLDVRAAGRFDLRDGKLGAVALDAAVIRAGTGQRQHDTELEMQARSQILAVETENLGDLIAGDAAGPGRRGVLRKRQAGGESLAQRGAAKLGAHATTA